MSAERDKVNSVAVMLREDYEIFKEVNADMFDDSEFEKYFKIYMAGYLTGYIRGES